MELTRYQRMVLMNQFLILARLYPDEALKYENNAKIVQMGFMRNYEWLLPMDEEVPEATCTEVLELLSMFDAIHESAASAGTLAQEDRQALKFRGFDANSEPGQFSYASFLMKDDGRYEWLARECEDEFLNSHSPVIDMYRRMYAKWEELGKPRTMEADILKSIADARLA